MSGTGTKGRRDEGTKGLASASLDALVYVCEGLPAFEAGTTNLKRTVVLAPDGWVESKSGRFLVDAEAGRLVQAAFDSHGVMRPLDYEHQTLGGEYARKDGLAPAAGWITGIHYQAGVGLIGDVVWLEGAAELIRSKEYLYLSPVTLVRQSDSRVIDIHSAGLTNEPAIPGMEPLEINRVNSWWLRADNVRKEIHTMPEPTPETGATSDPTVALARIAEVLGIEDTADIGALTQSILESVRKLKGGEKKGDDDGGDGEKPVASKAAIPRAVLEDLGLPADADESAVRVAVNTLKGSTETLTAVNTRLKAAEAKLAERDADEALRPHIERGAINPNDAEDVKVCKQLATNDRNMFDHVMAHRGDSSMLPPQGRTTAPPGGAGDRSRETVIVNSRKEFDANPKAAITDRVTYVNGALREESMTPLTDDEKTKLVA